MSQSVIINGVTYNAVPYIEVPKQGGGTAQFYDTSDATLNNGNKMLSGNSAYANGVKYDGNIPSKEAATYTPTTNDQTIAGNQYLNGAQVILGDANLISSNILSGVSIFNVPGSLTLPVVSQDSTTKVLSIS